MKKLQGSQSENNESSIQSPKGLRRQQKFLQSPEEKQKLIEQNIKLKTKLFQLSQQLEQVMGTQYKRYKTKESEDQATRAKRLQLKKQQIEVLNLRNKINIIKKQLQSVYSSDRKLLKKDDTLKQLRAEVENLQEEKRSLIRIKQQQTRALKIIKSEQQYRQRISQLKKQLNWLRQQGKNLNQNIIQSERALRKNHQKQILQKSKLKQIQNRLKQKKQNKSKKSMVFQNVTPQMIKELEEQVEQLDNLRRENEQSWMAKLNQLDKQVNAKQKYEQKKLLLLKQKQKQLRLSQIKIKQLKKVNRQRTVQTRSQEPTDVDMQQFRYKRNINYMRQ